MKLVNFVCPSCGAQLRVDADKKWAECPYCDTSTLIDDEAQHVRLDDAEQVGYEFEKGRMRAQSEQAAYQATYASAAAQPQKPKRKTWLWVLGWLFMFPVPLTILLVRDKNMGKRVRVGLIILAWFVYLAMEMYYNGGEDEGKTASGAEPSSAAVSQVDSSPSSESASVEESVGSKSEEADARASQLSAEADEEASDGADKEEKAGNEEKSKENVAQKAKDDKLALEACEGKLASEAYAIAESTDYKARFEDVSGKDVTSDVASDVDGGSEAGNAKVASVDIDDGGWFFKPSVKFTLDYEDPASRKAREEKEAKEAAREQAKKALEECKGKSAAEALEVVDSSGFNYRFLDPDKEDITSDVKDEAYEGASKQAKVKSVRVSGSDVTFVLDRMLTITADNNDEFAHILQLGDTSDESISRFAERYEGKLIEFDGCIAYMDHHGNTKTRYDILIYAMDYDPDGAIGPNFVYYDVAVTSLDWRGTISDGIHTGMNLHFIARVDSFNSFSEVFRLKPVELSLR